MDTTRQATRVAAEARYQLANEGQGEGQGNTESVRISASTTGGNSTDEEDRAPVSIPIPTPGAETASQAAITAPAPPSNIPRLVRAARRPRSQPGSTPERRRTGQEGNEMRAEVTKAEAPRQGDPLPESEPTVGNIRGEGWARRGGGVGSGRARRPSSLEHLRQRSEASPNNRGL